VRQIDGRHHREGCNPPPGRLDAGKLGKQNLVIRLFLNRMDIDIADGAFLVDQEDRPL